MIKDKDRTPVAQDLVTRCSRCKLELSHVVVVHNQEGIVYRVKCKTCGSEHKYHPDKRRTFAKPLKKTKRTVTIKENMAREFEKLAEKFKEKESVAYTMSGSFKPDDVIDHKTFGMGIVTRVSDEKMEVVFSEGPRILACNR
ncbi:MAG: hypothetical protein JRL30_20380 [Deltaproteobacteria bacterium]|nr:hypothetical protein [Deltaproteobacteria bacterium]